MFLATAVALSGLVLVLALLFAERSTPRAREQAEVATDAGGSASAPVPGGAPAAVERLVSTRLPRAVMGYEPVAVRRALATLATAYAELAGAVDDDVVRRAWERAQHPERRDADPVASDDPPDEPSGPSPAGHDAAAAPAWQPTGGRTGPSRTVRDERSDRDE